jgi:hypothetical protein
LKWATLPFFRFEVTSNALIIETNEDEYKRAEIEAICATGRRSNGAAASGQHIRARKFSLWSAFSIADEVYIQSGIWSFCLRYQQEQGGTGMITPLCTSMDILPAGVTTRITLRYSNEAKRDYTRLLKAVQDLPISTMLFLKTIRKLHINITDSDGERHEKSFTRQDEMNRPLRSTLIHSWTILDLSITERHTYLLFHDHQRNMPYHERRQGQTVADIVLAFPIDPITQQPKQSDSGQHVFTYFPLQRLSQIQVRCHNPLEKQV